MDHAKISMPTTQLQPPVAAGGEDPAPSGSHRRHFLAQVTPSPSAPPPGLTTTEPSDASCSSQSLVELGERPEPADDGCSKGVPVAENNPSPAHFGSYGDDQVQPPTQSHALSEVHRAGTALNRHIEPSTELRSSPEDRSQATIDHFGDELPTRRPQKRSRPVKERQTKRRLPLGELILVPHNRDSAYDVMKFSTQWCFRCLHEVG